MERISTDPTLDHQTIWHGAIPDRFGGHTKGELLAPRDERTNPVFLNGEVPDAPANSHQRGYMPVHQRLNKVA